MVQRAVMKRSQRKSEGDVFHNDHPPNEDRHVRRVDDNYPAEEFRVNGLCQLVALVEKFERRHVQSWFARQHSSKTTANEAQGRECKSKRFKPAPIPTPLGRVTVFDTLRWSSTGSHALCTHKGLPLTHI
jgi:hypothetical protein